MKLVSRYGLSFDGTDDYVETVSSSSLNALSFTWLAWVKTDVVANQIIMSKWNGTSNYIRIYFRSTAPYLSFLIMVDSSAYSVTTNNNYMDGNWHLITATYSSGEMKLYVDSELIGQRTGVPDPVYALTPVYVGSNDPSIDPGGVFDGIIDEVRIYNRALSSDEITTLYNRGHVSDGLVLWLPFEEGSGTTVYDRSGLHNHGTVYGASWTSGYDVDVMKYGKAYLLRKPERRVEDKVMRSLRGLSFDGVDDYVDCGNDASLQITNAITIAAWVKLTDVSSWRAVVDKFSSSTLNGYSLFIQQDTGKVRMEVSLSTIGTTSALGTTNVADGNWHFIVGQWTGDTIKVYVDGNHEISAYKGNATIVDSGTNLSIGARGSTGYLFQGLIDEVRIYNRALTDNEIYALYNDYILTDGLVLWLKMEEGTGTTAKDYSGNGNNGTINGATWTYGRHGWNI